MYVVVHYASPFGVPNGAIVRSCSSDNCNVNALGRALVEAGEVAAQHHKVGTHGKSKRHVVVVDDTAVGAHGHVDAGLLVVLVASAADIDQRGGLTTADTDRKSVV